MVLGIWTGQYDTGIGIFPKIPKFYGIWHWEWDWYSTLVFSASFTRSTSQRRRFFFSRPPSTSMFPRHIRKRRKQVIVHISLFLVSLQILLLHVTCDIKQPGHRRFPLSNLATYFCGWVSICFDDRVQIYERVDLLVFAQSCRNWKTLGPIHHIAFIFDAFTELRKWNRNISEKCPETQNLEKRKQQIETET